MSIEFVLAATARMERGSAAARRLRRAGQVPAVVYGREGGAQAISLQHDEIVTALQDEAIFSHIVSLTIAGAGTQNVLIKAVQRHPYKSKIVHVDFLRVNLNEAVELTVPLEVQNAASAPGVKLAGGMLQVYIPEILVRCLPAQLPETLVFDASQIEINQVVHLSEITLPPGVQLAEPISKPEQDQPVLACHPKRQTEEKTEAASQ